MTHPTSKPDAFPTTQRTWLASCLDRGEAGRSAAAGHVMEVYARPLSIYFLGSSFRGMGPADDIVNGFFADRLARPAFLDRWRDGGRPLRQWLIVAFKHYLFEECRRRRRGQHEPLPDESRLDRGDADRAFENECAMAIVRTALRRAGEACVERGQADHWLAFTRRHVEGRSLAEIGAELGVSEERANTMARTARTRFRETLREVVAWEEAGPGDIDGELRSLMEAIR